MGFKVLCTCDNCGLEEIVVLDRDDANTYSIIYSDDKVDESSVEFTSFDELLPYTDLGFKVVFIGVDRYNPEDYRLLCRECREAVRQVDKEVARIRRDKISKILKPVHGSRRLV